MSTPRISIIMPSLNGEKYLELSIKSFLQQGYENKELIIVDGKSTDRSHEIIEKYSSQCKDIVWIKRIDKGPSDATNIGLDKASGDVIGYMGSDDILCQGVFDEIAYYHQFVEYDVIYFDSYTYWIKEKRIELRRCPPIRFDKLNLLRFGTIVGLQDIYFKAHVFDKYRYDVDNKWSFDYELYLRISKENYLYFHVEKAATINIQDIGITYALAAKQSLETFQVAEKYCESLRELRIIQKRYRKGWEWLLSAYLDLRRRKRFEKGRLYREVEQ